MRVNDWPEMTGFGGRLRVLREAAGLSQTAIARDAGVHRNTIVGLEQGRYAPSWPLVVRLARLLGVGVEAFVSPPEESTHAAPP